MVVVTAAAITQIQQSAQQGGMEPGMGLRIEAQQAPDGHIHYRMGFDQPQLGDAVFAVGIDTSILVAPPSQALVKGMTLDFVELAPQQYQFVFLNPNDPHYIAPQV